MISSFKSEKKYESNPGIKYSFCFEPQMTLRSEVKDVRACDILKPFIINFRDNLKSQFNDILHLRIKKLTKEYLLNEAMENLFGGISIIDMVVKNPEQ